MSPKLTISAVVPAYNSEAFLLDAVNSIRNQTAPISEIIIIDDGSTDETASLVRDLGKDIRYFKQPNAGPSAARNRGISIAKGEWIAFLDADDQWTPDKTADQIKTLKKYPELVLVASDMCEISLNDDLLVESVLKKHDLLERFQHMSDKPLPNAMAALLEKNFIPTGTVLVKRTVLQDLGGFREEIRFGEDLELWARIAARYPITCLPKVHMLRRQHGSNATQSTTNMLTDLVKVMTSLREREPEYLRLQGIDPDQYLANALWNLGYWHFSNYDRKSARSALLASYKEKTSLRTLLYYFASMLPAQIIRLLRGAKQNIVAHGASSLN